MIDLLAALALALGLALGFGILIYMLRIALIRKPDQMRRFLDRRFTVIRKANPLPVIGIHSFGDDPRLILLLLMAAPLVFSGMFFGDSQAALRFLRVLDLKRYQPTPHKMLR